MAERQKIKIPATVFNSHDRFPRGVTINAVDSSHEIVNSTEFESPHPVRQITIHVDENGKLCLDIEE